MKYCYLLIPQSFRSLYGYYYKDPVENNIIIIDYDNRYHCLCPVNTMDILVDDAWTEIANNAPYPTVIDLGATCKHFNKLLKGDGLWRYLVDRDHHGVSIHNIGEPYLVQYKYLHNMLTNTDMSDVVPAAIRSNRMDAVKFVLARLAWVTRKLSEAQFQVSGNDVLLALKMGNIAILDLPQIKSRVIDIVGVQNASLLITRIHVLDWLATLPINIDIALLEKILAADEDFIPVILWFINRGILPTPNMLQEAANICCKLGYLDTLQTLKGYGGMPSSKGVYYACTAVPPRPYILQWLQRNGITANQRLLHLAIEKDDVVILEMFGKGYGYSVFELLHIVQSDAVNVFQWLQQQDTDNFKELKRRYPELTRTPYTLSTGSELLAMISMTDSLKILHLLDSQV
jgi:hypothetical protein